MLHDIFSAFVAAELEADWEKARAEHATPPWPSTYLEPTGNAVSTRYGRSSSSALRPNPATTVLRSSPT